MKVSFLVLLNVLLVKSAKILGVFPVAGKSMNILQNRLMTGLADAGHDVTVISGHANQRPLRNGSYRTVMLTGFADYYEEMLDAVPFLDTTEEFPISQYTHDFEVFLPIYNETFHHPNVVQFLKENHTFDLVVTEYLYGDATLALAFKYRCPLVVFNGNGGVQTWMNGMSGNFLPVSYVPHYHMIGDFSNGLTLIQRIHSLLFYLYDYYHHYWVQFPAHDSIIQTIPFPEGIKVPRASEVHYSPDLLMLGSHSSFRLPTPTVPNVVEIGGFHIDPPKKLPQELQDFLDNSTEGVIYFSMGSHVKSKNFSPERKQLLLDVFSKLPVKVLWKYEEELPGQSSNVFISKWFPQQDVLAHPNIKLFITHAGHGSIMEAIYHGIPTLTIPVFIDQFNNAFLAQSKGFALRLPYTDKNFTSTNLHWMIQQLLNNPSYKQKAKEISALFHDRPMKPLDYAVYWMEYVIRHKGADHLKVAGRRLSWYNYYMVDVFVIVCCVVLIFCWMLRQVGNKCMKYCRKVKTE